MIDVMIMNTQIDINVLVSDNNNLPGVFDIRRISGRNADVNDNMERVIENCYMDSIQNWMSNIKRFF